MEVAGSKDKIEKDLSAFLACRKTERREITETKSMFLSVSREKGGRLREI